MALRDYFPEGHEPRPNQSEGLDIIERSNKRFFTFEMPTGSGKSDLGFTVCNSSSGYILTPQNTLADQYRRDFDGFGLTTLEGKAHYQDDPPDGPDCLTAAATEHNHKENCTAYYPRRRQFLASPMGVTSYANFLAHPKWNARHWLVLDEGHNIESQILAFTGNELSPRHCSGYGLHLPVFPRESEARGWLHGTYLPKLAIRLADIEVQLKSYKRVGGVTANEQDEAAALAKEAEAIRRKQTALDLALTGDPYDWYMASDPKSGKLIIKPLNVAPYAARLFRRTDRVLIMTATVLNPKVFHENLGIDPAQVEFLAWGSNFPVTNRPIYYRPVGSMRYPCKRGCTWLCCRTKTLPLMAEKVVEIVRSYPAVKGIIHTQSYDINKHLVQALAAAGLQARVITHQNAAGRECAENLHRERIDEPTVLCSPGMGEGLDLYDDLSRFQIIIKVPFPNMGDPYILARKGRKNSDGESIGEDWYRWCTAVALIQASGRSIRSMTDHADTFILDADFESFLQNNKKLFSPWWREALVTGKNGAGGR